MKRRFMRNRADRSAMSGRFLMTDAIVKVFDTFAPIAGIVLHKSKVEKGSQSKSAMS